MHDKSDPPEKPVVDTKPPICYSLSNGALNSRDAAESPDESARPPVDFHGPPKSESTGMHSDLITLWKIWSETDRRLDSLAQCVREGVQVDEASNFARWLRFSAILTLLQPYEQEVPLPIRATELRRKCEDLIYECGEWYSCHERSNKPRDAYVSQSTLAAIENDLREIREALRLPQATVDAGDTALRVLPGAAI
jgi:hypothetical protein